MLPAMFRRIVSGCLLATALAFAQQKPDFAGESVGSYGPLHVKLHLTAGHDGALTGTVDSPDQNLFGLPCTDFRVNGQSLGFDVPMVHGSWTGFMSADGRSLSGTWSQGSPVPLNFTRSTAADATSTRDATSGAPPPQAGVTDVKWDDYTFRFIGSGQSAQVYEGGKIVGTILTMNGEQQVIPLPGIDSDKLKKSFDDYKAFTARSHSQGSSGATTATVAAPAQPAAPAPGGASPSVPAGGSATSVSAIRFDEAAHSITVPRPDGVTVTFVGEDVKIANFRRLNYIVRHQKRQCRKILRTHSRTSQRRGRQLIRRRRGIPAGRRRTHLRFGHGHQQRYAGEQPGADGQTALASGG